MNARFLILGLSAAGALALAACESNNTVIYDPATTKTGLRATRTVSSEEMREVTVAAVQEAMTNAKFTSFLRKYRQEVGDPDACPILKLDKTVNDTDDPDLNTSEITDMLFEELLNAGKVDVTLAKIEKMRVDDLSTSILDYLKQHGGTMSLTDKSSPEDILNTFNCSKKDFKKALGLLYKLHKVTLGDEVKLV